MIQADPITMTAGDTQVINFPISNSDQGGKALDLTGCTATFTLYRTAHLIEVFQKTIGSGLIVSDLMGGVLQLTIEMADTLELPPGDYYYRLKVVDALNHGDTVVGGVIKIAK